MWWAYVCDSGPKMVLLDMQIWQIEGTEGIAGQQTRIWAFLQRCK